MSNVYDFSAKLNSGKEKALADYRGKVLLIVNTASSADSRRSTRDWKSST